MGSRHSSLEKDVQRILQGTHRCLPKSRSSGLEVPYKYILFGFSRKGGSFHLTVLSKSKLVSHRQPNQVRGRDAER